MPTILWDTCTYMDRQTQRDRIPEKLLAAEWPSASEAEQHLLDFVGSLIVDTARTHPRITQNDVADWLASVILPRGRKVHR